MEVIDLQGALLAPWSSSSHVHLTETGIALDGLQLDSARSATELLDAVAAFCLSASGTDGTVLGHGWDESTWAGSHPAHRVRLNARPAAAKVRPSARDVHSALVSSSRRRPPDWTGLDGGTLAARSNAGSTPRPAWPRAGCRPASCAPTKRRALAEAAANGYVGLAEMAAPHIGSIEDLQLAAAWNSTAGGAQQRGCPRDPAVLA